MTVLGLLIPISVLLGLAGAGAFLWSVASNQFDDVDGAAARMLEDRPPPPPPDDA